MTKPKAKQILAEAWRLHQAEDHPEGYDGPCWGPTAKNLEQARKHLTETPKEETDV